MTFFVASATTITVHDDRSCKYPTLFGPTGKKLAFQDEGSSFNDSANLYRFVFQCDAVPVTGDTFIFATAERELAGQVMEGGAVQVEERTGIVTRAASGAPISIEGTPRPRMTIMIVTMNRREFLEKTLWYIYETSDDSERDIFIWDNASTDDTEAFLGTMVGWPGVRVFRSNVDLGVAGPRKKMISAVKTPYVFTLDDDVWMINKGWAGACSRVLDATHDIHQLTVHQGYVHSTNNLGSAHRILARPFFWVPLFQPLPAGPRVSVTLPTGQTGTTFVSVGDETVIAPTGTPTADDPRNGLQLPFAASGGAAAWRTDDVLALVPSQDRHLVCDLRESWGFRLMESKGTREGVIMGYGAFHPCPGALWHLGHGESYWQEKVRHSEAIYNRAAGEQARWLEVARATSGWGQPLEDPNEVLP